jgi:hypothetical protein
MLNRTTGSARWASHEQAQLLSTLNLVSAMSRFTEQLFANEEVSATASETEVRVMMRTCEELSRPAITPLELTITRLAPFGGIVR